MPATTSPQLLLDLHQATVAGFYDEEEKVFFLIGEETDGQPLDIYGKLRAAVHHRHSQHPGTDSRWCRCSPGTYGALRDLVPPGWEDSPAWHQAPSKEDVPMPEAVPLKAVPSIKQ